MPLWVAKSKQLGRQMAGMALTHAGGTFQMAC